MQALTREERILAEQNYPLIYMTLREAHLSEEFYDEAVLPYLQAVQEYCRAEEQMRSSFEEYARQEIRRALASYLRKENARRKEAIICSLEKLKNTPSKAPDVCDFVIARMEGEGKRKRMVAMRGAM